ncbi:uncharacterized protein LOC144145161 [Haemaphysalis longicornis]
MCWSNHCSFARQGTSALYILVAYMVLCEALQPMRWCGGPLNPWEAAKAGRMATSHFLACKNETIGLNIKASLIKEVPKICSAVRMCFAVAEDNQNTSAIFREKFIQCLEKLGKAWTTAYPWKPKEYNIDTDEVLAAFRRCWKNVRPEDLLYILKTVEYFKDFASG